METYGLTGKSGTGKSYVAIGLCRERGFDAIIDDGLFIFENRIAAGISAKREGTKIGAVKTALFTKEEHCRDVKETIRSMSPEKILILGTSEEMIRKIAARLELPALTEMIHIEDITTEEERELARAQRQELGKHVIPVPTFQLKRQFSGYFLDPLRMFRSLAGGRPAFTEKTVVRPTYSYLGDYIISDRVISDIVTHAAYQCGEQIADVGRVLADNGSEGMSIKVHLYMRRGVPMLSAAREFQKKAAAQVEHMTAFNVLSVDVEIRGLR